MERTSLQDSQSRLLWVWCGFTFVIAAVVAARTVGGGFLVSVCDGPATPGCADHAVDGSKRVWQWLMPMIIPTLTLMVGTVAAEARQDGEDASVSKRAFRLSLYLSIAYLLVLAAISLFSKTIADPNGSDMSSVILGPLQGLVGLSLGGFFVSRRAAEPAAPAKQLAESTTPRAADVSSPTA